MRLGQVLDNLLSNAIKYSPHGGPVTVRVAPAGTTVQVQVADRGMGMRAEDAEHVFGRFFRSSNARMSAIPGLGLGLAVVREIVERHGGTIRCDSAPGEGTVFTLALPLGESAGEGAPAAAGDGAPRSGDQVPVDRPPYSTRTEPSSGRTTTLPS